MRWGCGSLIAGSAVSWKGDGEATNLNGEGYPRPEQMADRGYLVPDDGVLLKALGNQLHGVRTFVLEPNAL